MDLIDELKQKKDEPKVVNDLLAKLGKFNFYPKPN